MSNRFDTVPVGPIRFSRASLDEAAAWLIQSATSGSAVAARFLNAWCVVCAQRAVEYRSLLSASGVNFADGTPVAMLMRARARDRRNVHVRGPSAFELVLRQSPKEVSHYLMGGTPETLEELRRAIEAKYPEANVVGAWAPPFGPFADIREEAFQRIRQSGANLVWVGLGSPKQDFAASDIAAECGVTAAGVGAAFDFLAGTVKPAPRLMQRVGLEWLHRLLSEPRRLWRRYLIGNLEFLWIVSSEMLAARINRSGQAA